MGITSPSAQGCCGMAYVTQVAQGLAHNKCSATDVLVYYSIRKKNTLSPRLMCSLEEESHLGDTKVRTKSHC